MTVERIALYSILIILIVPSAMAARLPDVGGDIDSWGTILNDYLNVTLTENGTLRENVVNSTHITDNTIVADDLAAGSVNSSHLFSDSVNSTHIEDGAITGDDISQTSNFTFNFINASSINSTQFGLDIEIVTDNCSNIGGCTANATCPSGKSIVFGFSSNTALACDIGPLNCNSYCPIGISSCTRTSSVDDASVYIICGKTS